MATRNEDTDSEEPNGRSPGVAKGTRLKLSIRSNSSQQQCHNGQRNVSKLPPIDTSKKPISLTNISSTNGNDHIQEANHSQSSRSSQIPVPVSGGTHRHMHDLPAEINTQARNLPTARGRREISANNSSGYGSAVSRTHSRRNSARNPFTGENLRLVNAACHEKKFYKMRHARRGYFLIFNFNSNDTPRDGSDIDVKALTRCFTTLQFDVKTYNNYTTREMKTELGTYANLDHSECDCFGIAILSHGKQGYIYTKDGTLSLDNIIGLVKNCSSLLGKPKLIFIQCCRTEIEIDAQLIRSPTFSCEADLLISYATTKGNLAFRVPSQGSPYIQKLTEILEEKGEQENLLELLTELNATVKENIDPYGVCQVTAYESTLSKNFKFDRVVKCYRCIQFADGRMEYQREEEARQE